MPLVDLTTVEGLHAQVDRPLLLGGLVVYLIHVFAVAKWAMPMVAARDQKRFLVGMSAAFGAFAIGVWGVYHFILPPFVALYREQQERAVMGTVMEWSGMDLSSLLYQCFGAGILCEIPVLAFVLGRFGIPVLQKRQPGYILILLVAVVVAPTPDLLTFLVCGVPFIVLYEIGLGALRLQRFHQKPDDKRHAH